ncbi:MAG: hypothetical protein LM590_14160 [Thermofilum sp.]|nr:hypothetical protein [Thermofilum sp.]
MAVALSAAATLIAVTALSAAGLLGRREVEVVRPRLMLDRYNAFGGTGVSTGSRSAASSTWPSAAGGGGW